MDLSQISLDPELLTHLFTVWSECQNNTLLLWKRKNMLSEEDKRMVLVHAAAVHEESVVNGVLELSRFWNGDSQTMKEVLKNVFVMWNCEKEKKHGYMCLTQLCQEQHERTICESFLQSESLRPKFVDLSVRDKDGNILKYSKQSVIRKYKLKVGIQYTLQFVISEAIKRPNSFHQMYKKRLCMTYRFICGLDREGKQCVLEGVESDSICGLNVTDGLSV
jgi:hypothetical protein